MRAPIAAALATLAAACAGPRASQGQAGADCRLEFLQKAPDRPYEVLSQLTTTTTPPPGGRAEDALRPQACRLGADAVIVTRHVVSNERGHTLVSGTAIRYTGPAPAPAETPAAAPPAAGAPQARPPPAGEPPPAPPAGEEPSPPPGSIRL